MRNRACGITMGWAAIVALILLTLGIPGAVRHTCSSDDFGSRETVIRGLHPCAACSIANAERCETPAPELAEAPICRSRDIVRYFSPYVSDPKFPISLRAPPFIS